MVATLPVLLNGAPADVQSQTKRFELFQYPLYQRDHPLPVPASAAQRDQHVASRWRPRANRVEMELPLDVRPSIYNAEKGSEFAEGCRRMGKIPVPGQVKQERPSNDTPRFDRMRLESSAVPNAAEYMVGTIKDGVLFYPFVFAYTGELHLTPLHAVLQLRPSMQHVDLQDQAEENERRRERGAPNSDEEGESAREKRPGVIPLSVSLRSDAQRSGVGGTRGPHDARDAEAERWVDLQWVNESAPGVRQAAEDLLLGPSRAPLYCNMRARDFL